MALRATLNARQVAAGLPLSLSGTLQSPTAADYASWSSVGFGVTTTSTPPTTFAALAHFDRFSSNSDTFPDAVAETIQEGYGNGVHYLESDLMQATVQVKPTGDYAVGRYVWVLAFGTTVPSGTDAVLARGGPYLIV